VAVLLTTLPLEFVTLTEKVAPESVINAAEVE
jgi:hypothetical protein